MKRDFLKILIVTFIAVFIRIICTPIFGGDPISTTEPFGNIAGLIGIIPSVIIMFSISYLHLALIGFYIIRKHIAGNYINGLIFGLLIGIIWLYGMFEAGILKNTSQYKELLFGISEAIPIVILGLLIAYALRKEMITSHKEIISDRNSISLNITKVIIIALMYLLFRYVSYVFINIESQYINKPIATFIWTFGNGFLIGLLYVSMNKWISSKKDIGKAVIFGIVVFGVDWLLYNLFVPVFFNVSLLELIRSFVLRSIIDVIGVYIGVYISITYEHKKNHLTTAST